MRCEIQPTPEVHAPCMGARTGCRKHGPPTGDDGDGGAQVERAHEVRTAAEGDEAHEQHADDGRLRPDGEGVPYEAVDQLQGDRKVG